MRLTLLGLVLLAGCAPTVQVTSFLPHPFPPQPDSAQVRIYETTTPTCSYEEVGHVSIAKDSKWTSADALTTALLTAARQLGGDAIVAFSQTAGTRSHGLIMGEDVSTVSARSATVLAGTVIRFTDPNCRR